jgi:hypothetical protein
MPETNSCGTRRRRWNTLLLSLDESTLSLGESTLKVQHPIALEELYKIIFQPLKTSRYNINFN